MSCVSLVRKDKSCRRYVKTKSENGRDEQQRGEYREFERLFYVHCNKQYRKRQCDIYNEKHIQQPCRQRNNDKENGKYHKYRYNVIEILFHSPATLCLSEIYEYLLLCR